MFELHQAFSGAFVEWALCYFIKDCSSYLCSIFIKHFGEPLSSGHYVLSSRIGLHIFVQPSSSIFRSFWEPSLNGPSFNALQHTPLGLRSSRTNERVLGPPPAWGAPEFRGITPGPRVIYPRGKEPGIGKPCL